MSGLVEDKCSVCDEELVTEIELVSRICSTCRLADEGKLGESDFDELLYREFRMEDY